jgi:hypothetical protein
VSSARLAIESPQVKRSVQPAGASWSATFAPS